MRFLSVCLPLALSLLKLAQATILEDHGYLVMSASNVDFVLSHNGDRNYQLINILSFHPWINIATIITANNDMEPERENKLGLDEIYTALSAKHGKVPSGVNWVISETNRDLKTDTLISEIRKNRGLDAKADVTVVAGDEEWTTILGTKYYKDAAMVNPKKLEKVAIKTIQRTMFSTTFDVDCFYFNFPERKATETGDQDGGAVDVEKERMKAWADKWEREWEGGWNSGKKETPMMKGMFIENEKERDESMEAIYTEIRKLILDIEENKDAPVSMI
ncbi:hypothetical protein HOO65_070023 [Ceratocystis lukuohia]|uniref:Uncharacterized protein n=1 Tax=Ceratocystis lukuohia TaxID=2019550 RepID=A0ABR4MBA4_9PEZI